MSSLLSDSGFYQVLNTMNRTRIQQQTAMLRLSTGLRINSGADDPAGLIASAILDFDLTASASAWNNADRVNSMMNVVDGAMTQISDLVDDIESLTVELANGSALSESEKQAKQLQIDSAIESIDRLVSATSFNGRRLIDGSYAVNVTGVDSTKITDVGISARSQADNTDLQVKVVSAASRAQVTFSAAGLASGNAVTLNVTGSLGTAQVSFVGSASISDMAGIVNANTASTGVSAIASNNVLYFRSEKYGDTELVKVDVISGSFSLTGGVSQDIGTDAVISVNGRLAGVNGSSVSFNVGGVTGSFNLTDAFQTTKGATESFTVTNGGATFALSPSLSDITTIGIGNLSSSSLGSGTLGYLSQLKSGGAYNPIDHPGQAQRIVKAASLQVAKAQAAVGAFQTHTIDGMKSMLSEAKTSLSSAISQIRDTDYALEMASLTRLNTLYQMQTAALSMIGENAMSVLKLFGAN